MVAANPVGSMSHHSSPSLPARKPTSRGQGKRKSSTFLVIFAAVIAQNVATAATSVDDIGLRLVFGDGPSSLSVKEQRDIYRQLGLTVSPRGNELLVNTREVCGPAHAKATIEDINQDGVSEVAVYYGNACTSGAAGTSLALFVKDRRGRYRGSFMYAASGFDRLSTWSHGFPDLKLRGAGACRAVWHWTGHHYDFFCNFPELPGACADRGDLCPQP